MMTEEMQNTTEFFPMGSLQDEINRSLLLADEDDLADEDEWEDEEEAEADEDEEDEEDEEEVDDAEQE
ncbi:hypothetical protein [Terriglobus roseus]|uniref:Uncharacterized protein n=1 Tax=Terriglobus roseus TaxID=392734 RepID=A0A1G7QCD2_9BACT|nr:hypothetical protein [Terriglobus roseus]SDF95579.1 hypothetical protein SAMN05444167_3815 [Terriglobus roseus]